MENKTIGSFLSALRKANGMTQQEVADILNVSNKTVSKWERDEGCPEIMMLPAIAELYDVTVDEILRGERITRVLREDTKNNRSQERVKALLDRASTKFTNQSIIAIILGAIALVLSCTISYVVYNYNVLWVGYVIILLLIGAAVAIIMIAANNLIHSIHDNELIEEQLRVSTMKKCVTGIALVLFISIATLIKLIIEIAYLPSIFYILPAFVVSGITVYLIYRFLCKKFNISQEELSEAQLIYRKKHIKVTAIIISVIIACSVAFPFIGAFVDTAFSSYSYCFADGVGYQYSTMKEAENEYQKLKDFITEDRILYTAFDVEYSISSDECTLYYRQIGDIFEKTEKGYRLVSSGVISSEEESKKFSSEEEMEKFKDENVYYDEYLSMGILQKNVTFDDETLTVNYKTNTNYFRVATDILGLFIIIGSAVSLVVAGVSSVLYFRKNKLLS